MNSILRYFDLQSGYRPIVPPGHSSSGTHAPVFPQYLALAAGVVVEPSLRHYVESGAWQFDFWSFIGRLVFGLIVGIIILPAVYKSSFDPQKPILIQLAALFPLGIGWQSLFSSATKMTVG